MRFLLDGRDGMGLRLWDFVDEGVELLFEIGVISFVLEFGNWRRRSFRPIHLFIIINLEKITILYFKYSKNIYRNFHQNLHQKFSNKSDRFNTEYYSFLCVRFLLIWFLSFFKEINLLRNILEVFVMSIWESFWGKGTDSLFHNHHR